MNDEIIDPSLPDNPDDIRLRMAECNARYIQALKNWHQKRAEELQAYNEVEHECSLMLNLRTRLHYANIKIKGDANDR